MQSFKDYLANKDSKTSVQSSGLPSFSQFMQGRTPTPEEPGFFSKVATGVKNLVTSGIISNPLSPINTSLPKPVLKGVEDFGTNLWSTYEQTPKKIIETVKTGASDLQKNGLNTQNYQGQKALAKVVLGTAGAAANAIFAPLSAAIGAVLNQSGGQKLIDSTGQTIADKSGITDMPAFQRFALTHPNAGEYFNDALIIAMSGAEKGKIEPKTFLDRTYKAAKEMVDNSPKLPPPTPELPPSQGDLIVPKNGEVRITQPPTFKEFIDPLFQEAKKYKSAEEFVNSQSVLFRSGEKGNFFSDSKKYVYEGGFKSPIREVILPTDSKILDVKFTDELNKFANKDELNVLNNHPTDTNLRDVWNNILQRNGYDGMRFAEEGGSKTTFLTNSAKSKIQTKSQLTDIWNKANQSNISITSQKIQEQAKGLNVDFSNVPEIERMRLKEESAKAQEFIKTNPDEALKVLDRPRMDLRDESVFVELKKKAIAEGDVAMIQKLAESKIGTEAAQALKALDDGYRLEADPVKAIQEIKVTKEKAIRDFEKVSETVTKEIKKAKESIKATKETWSSFVESIKCNY